MAMTPQVKSELAAIVVKKSCCRRAELATTLRLAGGLHLAGGKIVIEAELDNDLAARRLQAAITDLFAIQSQRVAVESSGGRRSPRYLIRVVQGGDSLARQTGLVDSHGRPARGLPAQVVGGGLCDAQAAWRGAFLAQGSLSEPGRSMALEIACPGLEAALALVGAARRLGITAKAKESRGVDRVAIRDAEAIQAMLGKMGAQHAAGSWAQRRSRREVRAQAHRLPNFDDANLRRSAQAAAAASIRVTRAIEILGDEVPDHLRKAGELRAQHRQASLEELGQLHDPPLTKDAVAGRIRRLLATADKRAEELGIPDTEAELTPDLLGD